MSEVFFEPLTVEEQNILFGGPMPDAYKVTLPNTHLKDLAIGYLSLDDFFEKVELIPKVAKKIFLRNENVHREYAKRSRDFATFDLNPLDLLDFNVTPILDNTEYVAMIALKASLQELLINKHSENENND